MSDITFDNIELVDVISGNHQTISSAFIDNVFQIVENNTDGIKSIFHCISQYMFGDHTKHAFIETKICDYLQKTSSKSLTSDIKTLFPKGENLPRKLNNCNFDNVRAYLIIIKHFYKLNSVLFYNKNKRDVYKIFTSFNSVSSDTIYIVETPRNFKLLVVKRGHRSPYRAPDIVESVKEYKYVNRPYKSLKDVRFKIHWEGWEDKDDTWEEYKNVDDNVVFHKYIQDVSKKANKPLFVTPAYKDIEKRFGFNDQEKNNEPVAVRTRARRILDDVPSAKRKTRKKKNLTGKKMTIVGDVLDLNKKGGIYAYYPYETLDEKKKGIFKVGMSTNFKGRFEQIHSYHPNGVYLVAFYANPDVPEWTPAQIKKWRDDQKKRKKIEDDSDEEDGNGDGKKKRVPKKPPKKTMNTKLYKKMEEFVFKYLEDHRAKRIHSTSRVNNPDEEKMGATEYFYTNEDLVHEAFKAASEKFKGGILTKYYLQGIDSTTGEMVENINDLAKQREHSTPSFTGKVIYRL